MKTIPINQKDFNRIFQKHNYDYAHPHEFMEGQETIKDFEKTKKSQMLNRFRETLEKLKKDLENV